MLAKNSRVYAGDFPSAYNGTKGKHHVQMHKTAPAEKVEQQNMSIFDAQQHKLDEELDKHLNICRGC